LGEGVTGEIEKCLIQGVGARALTLGQGVETLRIVWFKETGWGWSSTNLSFFHLRTKFLDIKNPIDDLNTP